MLATLEGFDHAVILVHDLDAAAQRWRELGFTLSPRGTHSTHLGTGNYTLMFDDDYLELLGVLAATELNASSRAFLARRGEGIDRVALRTRDAQAGVNALVQQGIAAQGPVHFNRPVALPDGGSAEAAFSIFSWPDALCPADLRLFACQHHTRAAVWVPSLTQHANTVIGIDRVDVIAADPPGAATQMAQLIGSSSAPHASGAQVETAPGHAALRFMTRDAFTRTHGIGAHDPLPAEGAAALVLRVADLAAARRCAGTAGQWLENRVVVPAAQANGVALIFRQA